MGSPFNRSMRLLGPSLAGTHYLPGPQHGDFGLVAHADAPHLPSYRHAVEELRLSGDPKRGLCLVVHRGLQPFVVRAAQASLRRTSLRKRDGGETTAGFLHPDCARRYPIEVSNLVCDGKMAIFAFSDKNRSSTHQ